MTRRAVTSWALAAVLCMALVGQTSRPALAAPGEDATPIENPDLTAACGIDIHVILDESSSVGLQLAPGVRSAFRAFTTALNNTNSRMAVSDFSMVAELPLAGAAARQYTSVTDATIAGIFEPYIANGYVPSGSTTQGTNWEDAFRIGRYFLPRPGTQPHLVVFITDGDPNRAIRADRVTYDPGNPNATQDEYELKVPLDRTTETASAGSEAAKNAAVSNANALKAQGSHILTVAVGEAVNNQASLDRIIDVSGPDVFNGTGTFDIATDDVYRVPNFADLQAALSDAAFQLCAPSVTVQKLVDLTPGTDDELTPGEDWEISATADPEPADWVLPPDATGSTATTLTDPTGFASFQWSTTAPTASDVVISETPQDGFVNDQSATRCTYRTPDQGDTPLPIEVTDGGFSADVPHRAIVTCRLVNRAVPEPAISIEKATNGADADAPFGPFIPIGGTVTWTYVVTNTGNTRLSEIDVADNRDVAITCPGTELAPGESMRCTASGIAADGEYANVGSVTAVDPFGTSVSDDDPSHYFGATAGIDIEKAVNLEDADEAPGVFIPVGDDVTWTYVVTNTGNSVLTGITVADDELGDITCPADTLSPQASMECTAQSGTAAAGPYENLATATGVNGLGQTAQDSDPAHYFGEDASVDIEKFTNGQDADDPTGPFIPVGGQVNWAYRVVNTGNVLISNLQVTDPQVGPLLCPRNFSLAPGQQLVCRGAGTATAGQYANTGQVTAQAPSGAGVGDDDPSHYFGVQGGIDLEKLVEDQDADQAPGPVIPVGDAVTWTYQVTNTGNSELTNVRVADFRRGVVVDCPEDTLAPAGAPGDSMTCEAGGEATPGQYTNFAAALGTVPTGQDVSDSDPANYFGAAPGILLKKFTNGIDADDPPGPYIPVGEPVEWTYVVTNTGNDELTGIAVTDDRGVQVTCPDTTLAAGEEMTCTAAGTSARGDYENDSEVTATDGTQTVSDTDPSHYFGSVSAIHVEKATNGVDADDPAGPQVPPGGPVVWTYEVTNPGNVPIRNVTLVDDDPRVTPEFTGGDADGDQALDPGETWAYRASGTAASGQYVNTAAATGLDVLENPLTDGDPSHHIAQIPPLPPPLPPPPTPEPPQAQPRLDVRKQATRRRVRAGRVVQFRMRVRNTGRAAARRVRLCDRLPAGLVFASAGGAQIQGRRACFAIRRLGARDSRSFVVRARAERTGRRRTVCNVAAGTARGVRVRRARACIRILPRIVQRPGGVTG